jgi:hypothetical protein
MENQHSEKSPNTAKIIEVPGVGKVEFPAGMSDSEIAVAIQRNFPDAVQKTQGPYAALADSQRRSWEIQQQKAKDQERAESAALPYAVTGVLALSTLGVILMLKLAKSRPLRALPHAMRSASKMKDRMAFDWTEQDAELFALAEEEMVSGSPDRATWAQALVRAEGSEEKRRAEYIVLRVKKMRLEGP